MFCYYCCSVAKLYPTLCNCLTAAHQAPLSPTISQSSLKFMSVESVMLSNHLILCCPLLLLPSIFPSIRVFSGEWALRIRWSKYWNFSNSPFNEYSGLISFRTDWFVLLARDSQESSLVPQVLQCSAFFMLYLFSCLPLNNISFRTVLLFAALSLISRTNTLLLFVE